MGKEKLNPFCRAMITTHASDKLKIKPNECKKIKS